MKTHRTKCKLLLLAAMMIACAAPENVYAEENHSYCFPTEEQIQAYKEDGTWEKRQEYVKTLNHAAPSQELLYNAIQRENGFAKYAAGDNIPDDWKGMQVTGDAKMLLVRVEFADIKFENSKIYSEETFYEMVMGNDHTERFPYESLNAYYKRSSYNKLNITSDQVYSCTLSKNRDAYEWSDFGEQDLIKEVFEILDSTVDFSDYDANQDGQIDSICINFAGENSGWGSTWWSHQYKFQDPTLQFDGVTPAGYVFLETDVYDDTYGTQTLIHETGHLLGLPDYYSQMSNGIDTTDMMNNNSGDHNGFSKWLLGWIEKENILRITKESGNTEVKLSPIASEIPDDDKLIAVIAPEDPSIYSEYFIVQYDEYMGNQSVFELEKPAYRIFHVDASLDYFGTNFKYDNLYAYDHFLIRSVPIVLNEYGGRCSYYIEGDAFTPDTNESSAFYGGNVFGYTGIEITDFKTGDDPSFHVSFREKEIVDGKLEFQVIEETPSNMAAFTLLSNKPLANADPYQMAYLEDSEGNQHFIDLELENGSQKVEFSYIFITASLKPETEYTLVIPEGMFQVDKDVYSEECRLTIKTGTFPELETIYTYAPNAITDAFRLDDTRSGFIHIVDSNDEYWLAKLYVFEGSEEVDVININIPIPESYTWARNMKAVTCYDGTIALEVCSVHPEDYRTISNFYKIDQTGKVLAGPFSTVDTLDFFPIGNSIKGVLADSGAAGAPDMDNDLKLEIYTFDFENEPTSRLIPMNKYASTVHTLDEESYIVIQNTELKPNASIFNMNDEQILSMDLSTSITGSAVAATKAGDHLAFICSSYSEDNEYVFSVSEFDMEGNHLGTREIIRFNDWKDSDEWKIEKARWGYTLCNYTSTQPYHILFLNHEFELISFMQLPDSIASGASMGSRYLAFWYDFTTMSYTAAITEPIVAENTEDTEDPEPDTPSEDDDTEDTEDPEPDTPSEDDGTEDTEDPKPDKPSEDENPKPDSPSEESRPENTDSPDTGDESRLSLLLFALILSGGILATGVLQYKYKKS